MSAIRISDSRLQHKPLFESPACQAALQILDLPGPTMMWANLLKWSSLSQILESPVWYTIKLLQNILNRLPAVGFLRCKIWNEALCVNNLSRRYFQWEPSKEVDRAGQWREEFYQEYNFSTVLISTSYIELYQRFGLRWRRRAELPYSAAVSCWVRISRAL